MNALGKLLTVFVFLGIEGASVYSRFARERSDIGFATIIGFIIVTSMMVLVTLLPFAVLQRADIAGQTAPSMAGVLESVVGPWGRLFISAGVIVSVLDYGYVVELTGSAFAGGGQAVAFCSWFCSSG